MNIALNKLTDNTETVTISVQESDYQAKVDAKLKEVSRKTILPGFRPGKVPAGIIKKMHGESILIEEVTSLLNEALNNYIKEKKFHPVGGPLPNHDKTNAIDWGTQKDFDFEFEVGWVNDFALDISPNVSIPHYEIPVSDKMIDEAVMMLRNRHGTFEIPETTEAGDTLSGDIVVDEYEPCITSFSLSLFSADEVKPFVGLKKDQSLTLDISALPEEVSSRSTILRIAEDEVEDAKGKFTFTLGSISRRKPAEMNEEFFTTALGTPEIKTEEAFREKVKELLAIKNKLISNHWLTNSIEQYFVEHTSISFPEDFLRRWMKEKNEDISDEELEKELPHLIKDIKWNLIEGKIVKENNIIVEQKEVIKEAYESCRLRVGLSKKESLENQHFSDYVHEYLLGEDRKGEKFTQLYEELVYEKVVAFIKEKITLDKKEASTDEYKKMLEELDQYSII